MLNPIFKEVYSKDAVDGLQYLADYCEPRGLNGVIRGVNTLTPGLVVPMLFVYDGEDDAKGSLYIAVSEAARIMTKSISEEDDDFCGSIVFWPKHMGEVVRKREVIGNLWV